ncbi:MAG: hypothetical protein H7840_00435 [Alphaproteobacteria bacterium]
MRDYERRANGLASGILSYLPTDDHRRAFLGGAPPKPLPFGVKSIAPDTLAGTAGDDTLGQSSSNEDKKPQESETTTGGESEKPQQNETPTNDEPQKPQEQQTAEIPPSNSEGSEQRSEQDTATPPDSTDDKAPRQPPSPPDQKEGMLRPPTNDPVDPQTIYRDLGFDPDQTPGQWEAAAGSPLKAIKANALSNEAMEAARNAINNGDFPKDSIHNGEADAFRHALWSYRMTQELGPEAARAFGDGHEITSKNEDGERLMDLYNNRAASDLARDPKNQGRAPEEVIREAMKDGKFQLQPFVLEKTPAHLKFPPRGGYINR